MTALVSPPAALGSHDTLRNAAEARRRGGSMHINDITERIIAAAIEVHRHLGPGLAEVSYERALRNRTG